MKRYEVIGPIGDGAFGTVMKCLEKETGQFVAIKKMKERHRTWEECLELKEVKSLRKIGKIGHENIVEMKTVFRENDFLHLVFELCGPSLLSAIKQHPSGLPEAFIRSTISQLLSGLQVIHQQGFFHRDIKPENLLFSGDTLKIVDFGLAREIRSRPPYTQYAGTRWYRAPEILLRNTFYNAPVDIWAVGAITAEMFTMRPLFQGSSETDQIFKICSILGPPTTLTWPEGVKLAARLGVKFVNSPPTALGPAVPNASLEAIEFIQALLALDPNKRPSAKKALTLPFLQGPKMKLSELAPRRTSSSLPIPLSVPPMMVRPHAAISPSPRNPITRSLSQESLEGFFKGPMKGFVPGQPIDYSAFNAEPQGFDDILDDL
jgi:protein kinase